MLFSQQQQQQQQHPYTTLFLQIWTCDALQFALKASDFVAMALVLVVDLTESSW